MHSETEEIDDLLQRVALGSQAADLGLMRPERGASVPRRLGVLQCCRHACSLSSGPHSGVTAATLADEFSKFLLPFGGAGDALAGGVSLELIIPALGGRGFQSNVDRDSSGTWTGLLEMVDSLCGELE